MNGIVVSKLLSGMFPVLRAVSHDAHLLRHVAVDREGVLRLLVLHTRTYIHRAVVKTKLFIGHGFFQYKS